MTATEAKWAERVREWRSSGKRPEEFAEGKAFESSTLRYWASRLKSGAAAGSKPALVVARAPRLARVVRMPTRPSESGLEITVGSARIRLRRGFDAELLREVIAALGASA